MSQNQFTKFTHVVHPQLDPEEGKKSTGHNRCTFCCGVIMRGSKEAAFCDEGLYSLSEIIFTLLFKSLLDPYLYFLYSNKNLFTLSHKNSD